MRKQMLCGVVGVMLLAGCGELRYGATEAMKANAWVHAQVCAAASQTASEEGVSATLCELTGLAQKQSEAFVLDYGLPKQQSGDQGQAQGPAPTNEELELLAQAASADAAKRPDAWALADGALDLGIALAGLLGGVYGVRAAQFLQQAREKSKAVKEIVAGNELFKQLYPEQAQRFKEAQKKQSPSTKQLVTQLKQ